MKRVPMLLCLLLIGVRGGAAQQEYDLVIRGARVLDGSGNPWSYVDVAVSGDRIAAVGSLVSVRARRSIDATGLYLTPGFIDVHSHAGAGLISAPLSQARPLLAQGITTVIINHDGHGAVDLARQRHELEEHGLGVNVGQLVPHGSIRERVLRMEDRAPTDAELEEMLRLAEQGMQDGGLGLSSGLYYAPGSYAQLPELVALAGIATRYGGVYTSHIRDESDYNIGLLAAVDEVIDISRQARLPGIVTHIKALGPHAWGLSAAVIRRIRTARAEGLEIFADQYPYPAGSTGLTAALVPRWAEVGGWEALAQRLESPETRPRLRADMRVNLQRRGGAERLLLLRHPTDPRVEGKTLQQVADRRGTNATDAAIDLIRSAKEEGVGLVSFSMEEEDIERYMIQPWTMTCTDGGLILPEEGILHPRGYGAFPRKIRRYVVERGLVGLASAIRSMTWLSATVFPLPERGVIRSGGVADLVLFDLEELRDLATYEHPHRLSAGIRTVVVNGELAIDDGRPTGVFSGRVLRRSTSPLAVTVEPRATRTAPPATR